MSLIAQLDLTRFIEHFSTFLARPKDFAPSHTPPNIWEHLQELEHLDCTPPPALICLKDALKAFKKGGVWRLDTLFAFVQITRYFAYLKALASPKQHPHLYAYLDNIHFPPALLELSTHMQDTPTLKSGFYPDLDALSESLARLQAQQKKLLNQILNKSGLQSYLVDRQVHFVNGIESLLVKPGFSVAIKGQVILRSHMGYFYIEPLEARDLSRKIQEVQTKIEENLARICTHWSGLLRPHFLFLRFINHEFDYIDHIIARVQFAKSANLSFIKPNNRGDFTLSHFAHPNLNNPKPISLRFDRSLLLITGVNTGGKTMLLKSILSAVFLAKHFLPFKIHAPTSAIPYIEHIQAIINDPQNSQNDISTFAGRMLDFQRALNTPQLLLGVDEIELGTDASEASCLYKVLLEKLMTQGAKIVVTTHHKHLALLLAKNHAIQLLAAHFDPQAQLPTYTFSPGLIGKSYAFESALRYGVPLEIINQARALYGAEQENLNALIERTSALEQELRVQHAQLEEAKKAHSQQIQEELEQLQAKAQAQQAKQNALEKSYQQALRALQDALKEFERTQNKSHAHQQIQAIKASLTQPKPTPKTTTNPPALTQGACVRYKNQLGSIISLNKESCLVALDNGLKIKINAQELTLATPPKIPPQVKLERKPTAQASMRLDVRALEVLEALQQAQDFLANALLAGFEEVLIVHGKGKGILRQALREWLKKHPKVIAFEDAPYNLGGSGAQVVKI
ncbi:Recombination inhibitory protein MutS2 [Helicobacter bizzozeronii CIII-1]|uniref:Endonuclease MutS2 n=2 Tax=Helicobacter bizzozeronii TaxID=56877 RepID=F8KP97_HELBC|nr:endonuclease MutS2 [Helicobacter bizzozeronii]CCB80607.1 Recombination inhibitory protein MutS2 [Helicobacter bizzozeronii CIII-1]